MAFALLLQHGIETLGKAHRAELSAVVRDQSRVDAVLAALSYVPVTLTALAEVAWAENASILARSVLLVVLGYGFKKGNLVPAEEGKPLLGVVDDAYIALFGATRIVDLLGGVQRDQLLEHAAALREALPLGVADELEAMIEYSLKQVANTEVR